MDEKNYSILERVVDKLFSGSFSVLIMVGITYCMVTMCCVYLTLKGKLDPKDFLLIVGGLSTVLMALWKDYMALKKEEGVKVNGDGEKGDKENFIISAKPVVTSVKKGESDESTNVDKGSVESGGTKI